MTNLDELRQKVLRQDEPDLDDFGITTAATPQIDDGRIFGLTAVERMFLSVALFMVVTAFSLMLLMVTESIAIP